jgi:hypothetical protein
VATSAAFRLEPSGPPTACDFPKCVLDAFHNGDHEFCREAALQSRPRPQPVLHCVACGRGFIVYGDLAHPIPRTCGSQECILHLARREAAPVPVVCTCRQRPYAHELPIHAQIASESFNPKLRFRYPWSLMLSSRVEPSTERKQEV